METVGDQGRLWAQIVQDLWAQTRVYFALTRFEPLPRPVLGLSIHRENPGYDSPIEARDRSRRSSDSRKPWVPVSDLAFYLLIFVLISPCLVVPAASIYVRNFIFDDPVGLCRYWYEGRWVRVLRRRAGGTACRYWELVLRFWRWFGLIFRLPFCNGTANSSHCYSIYWLDWFYTELWISHIIIPHIVTYFFYFTLLFTINCGITCWFC